MRLRARTARGRRKRCVPSVETASPERASPSPAPESSGRAPRAVRSHELVLELELVPSRAPAVVPVSRSSPSRGRRAPAAQPRLGAVPWMAASGAHHWSAAALGRMTRPERPRTRRNERARGGDLETKLVKRRHRPLNPLPGMSSAAASTGRPVDGSFIRSRLGSFLAVVPLTIWTIDHLWNNLAAFKGAEAWQSQVTEYSHPIAFVASSCRWRSTRSGASAASGRRR